MSAAVALVTGAGSGIGHASALAFAASGARVVVADFDRAGGAATVELIEERGGEGAFLSCDVSDEEDVRGLVAELIDRYGRLDFAHNNAGIDGDMTRRVGDQSSDVWHRVVAVNLAGVFFCMKYELPVMARQGAGVIVNTASIAGLRGFGKAGPYVASKHGVVGLTRVAALDYASAGVRVNAVCPGIVETGMVAEAAQSNPRMIEGLTAGTPMKRLGQPEEIAAAVLWLCSDAASFVTGQTIPVDGGFTAS